MFLSDVIDIEHFVFSACVSSGTGTGTGTNNSTTNGSILTQHHVSYGFIAILAAVFVAMYCASNNGF
jgi:hypothetical protein